MNLLTGGVLLAVAAGGALGSVLRLVVGSWVTKRVMTGLDEVFPLATLLVNVGGSFCIGCVFAWLEYAVREPALRENLRLFLIVGVLGGFTTFSTFSLEVVQLAESGLWGKALLHIIASVTLCVAAAYASLAMVRCLTST